MNTIFMVITFILLLAIFLSILFGCTFKYSENFENAEKKVVEVKEIEATTKKVEEIVKKPTKIELTAIEKSVKKGVENGTMSEKDVLESIKSGKFTKENLDRIIEDLSSK